MTAKGFDRGNTAAGTARAMLVATLVLAGLPAPAQALSQDAQELMALRETHAPVNCELTRLSRQLNAAHSAGDRDKARALTERMRALDKQLSPDKARMEELRKRVRGTADYPAIMEQQLKFDKACNPQSRKP